MSLINEALKKAQKQRTGEAPTLSSLPSIGGQSPARIAKRSAPSGFAALLVKISLGVVTLAVVIIGGVFLFRGKGTASTPAPAPGTVAASPAVAAAPATTAPNPAPIAPAAITPPPPTSSTQASTFVVPNVSAGTAPAQAPAKSEPVAAKPSPEPAKAEPVRTVVTTAPAPVVEAPKPEPAKGPAPALKLEPRAINYIEGIRVAGIRASSTDSKVLMNDRVYRVGDMVEHEMSLKLVGITSTSLTFEDDRGAKYTRSF